MPEAMPRVCIVILNWNGWRDTIECLESIRELDYNEMCTVIVDNNSTDDSVVRITAWAQASPRTATGASGERRLTVVPYEGKPGQLAQATPLLGNEATLLIRSDENLGFAAGSNLGIRMAMRAGIEYVWLLNNDAVAAPESLRRLVEFLDQHPEFAGVTGQIRYYAKPDAIWNCGGALLPPGLRRYYFRNAPTSKAPALGHRRVSFMTGCAALLRTEMLLRSGPLSEDFFFGEEDFELCQRLKRSGQLLACRYDAVIYHKVGTSISKASRNRAAATVYLNHLNRFVHMRRYWPDVAWTLWRLGYCLYLLYLLTGAYALPVRKSITLVRRLLVESQRLRQVNRHTFQAVLARENEISTAARTTAA